MSILTQLAQQVTEPLASIPSVSSGSSSFSFGSWVELITSTIAPTTINALPFDSITNAGRTIEVQLGTGPLGSETPGPSYLVYFSNTAIGPCVVPLDVPWGGIPTATRVVIRIRTDAGSTQTMAIGTHYYNRFDSDHQTAALASYVPYGAIGVSVTPSGTAWTNSALGVLTTGLGFEAAVTSFAGKFDPSIGGAQGFELDLLGGPVGGELVLTTARAGNVSRAGFGLVPLKDGYPVPASTRLTVRQRQSGQAGSVSIVQHNQVPGSTGTTDPINAGYTTNVTAGNVLFFSYATDQASGSATFSKNSGTATVSGFTTVQTVNDPTHTYSIAIGCAVVTGSGSLSIHAAWSIAGGGNSNLQVVEVNFGTAMTSLVTDGVSGGLVGSGTSASTTVTTTQAGDFVFGVAGVNSNSIVISAGGGFTAIETAAFLQNEYQTQPSAGALTVSWSSNSATTWLVAAAAFKVPTVSNTNPWTISANLIPTAVLPAPPPSSGGGTTPTGTNPGTGTSLCGSTVPLFWADLLLDSGTKSYSWLDQPINDLTTGQRLPRITAYTPAKRQLSDNTGRYISASGNITLDDSDGTIRTLIAQNRIIRRELNLYMLDDAAYRTGSPGFRVGHFLTYDYALNADRTVTLFFESRLGTQAATNLQNQLVPRRLLDTTTFPNLPLALIGKAEPIWYGLLSDETAVNWVPMGSVPVVDVGVRTLNGITVYEGLIAGHACSGVISVYGSNGDPSTPILAKQATTLYTDTIGLPGDSGYWQTLTGGTAKYRVINGKRYTVIYFRTGSAIGEDFHNNRVPVFVNLAGIEDVGDSTGNLITSGFRQGQHFLTNFVFQNHNTDSNWYPLPTLNGGAYSAIDTASIEAAKTQSELRIPGGYTGGIGIGWDGTQVPIADVLQKLALGYDFSWAENRHGQVMVSIEAPAMGSKKDLTPLKTQEDSFQYQIDRTKLANYVSCAMLKLYVNPGQATLEAHGLPANWVYSNQFLSDGDSIKALAGSNDPADPVGTKTFHFENWVSRDVNIATTGQLFVDVLNHLVRRYAAGPAYLTILTDLCGLDLELGDAFTLTHYANPVDALNPARRFRLLGSELLPPNLATKDFHVLLYALDVTNGLIP